MSNVRLAIAVGILAMTIGPGPLVAQEPDHPVFTEVFNNPAGPNDGPVGRDPSNPHQEYLELYLPTAGGLSPSLNKDALRLTIYEVEGDSSSSGTGLVNYRIDLPTFDVDPSNGLTPGAVARPAGGVVVIGWVDYVGDPSFALAGTPSSRVGLVNGGITSATDYVFVALNGAQFGGTTNFPVPTAISSIDLPDEARSGIIQNGSGAYLLFNRDDVGYVELYDDENVPVGGSANPSLATGLVLGTSALLDGFAGNDHGRFDVFEQPYVSPTGDDIDLETVLPFGGAFSRLVAQVAEAGEHGYARRFVDLVKTTEDGILFNEDPVADAIGAYRTRSVFGPFYPTPGRAPFTSSPPELSVAVDPANVTDVLAQTTGNKPVVCANVGGNFGMAVAAVPGPSSDPLTAVFAVGDIGMVLTGQTRVFPSLAATVPAGAIHGAVASATATLTAANTVVGDPAVLNPTGATTATVRVLNPTTGRDANGLPFQATTFVAIHGLPRQPGVNEFLGTSLAQFVAANLGGLVDDERHNGALLLNPLTNLSDPFLVDTMEHDMPDDPIDFINVPSPAGLESLVTTVLTSAEVAAGNGTYDDSLNITRTALRAIGLNIAETATAGGTFVPTERIHFVEAAGDAGKASSGLTGATTTRGFELALLDTNVQQAGTLETGQTDDFGLIVEVGRTRVGATVVPGQFVFLSYTGGLEGADVDTLDVPPHGNQTVIVYVDLELLDTVLGCETITRLFVIDGNGGTAINVIEAFSLNAVLTCPCTGDVNLDGTVNGRDISAFVDQVIVPGDPSTSPAACAADLSRNGTVGFEDVAIMVGTLLSGNCGP